MENKNLRSFVNDVLALDEKQTTLLNDIAGLRVAFEDSGEMSEVKLSNPEKILYEEKF